MQKNCLLTFDKTSINAQIRLTGSKSESNRALVLNAISKGLVEIENLSEAFDTAILVDSLKLVIGSDSGLRTQDSRLINIGPAGTAMRFLTAFLTTQNGNFLLTGSDRMKERPIGILVDALRALGANVSYAEKEGFPPLEIKGGFEQKTAGIKIKGDISSQYISALLMIAPALPKGLNLEIEGELTSRPYVEMTLAMLEQAGIRYTFDEQLLTITPQEFKPAKLYVEPDWSAASYWYSIAALALDATLFLPGLNKYSLQGDSRITELMANFGITSVFKDGGVEIKKETSLTGRKIFDLKDCPDLAQTLIVCCAALGQNARFTGLETLKIKETDRIKALQNELSKIGVRLIEKGFTYQLDCSGLNFPDKLTIKTYEDHRMAMAFAPLALLINEVEIEDMDVVEKSYPTFWDDLQKAGFSLIQSNGL